MAMTLRQSEYEMLVRFDDNLTFLCRHFSTQMCENHMHTSSANCEVLFVWGYND